MNNKYFLHLMRRKANHGGRKAVEDCEEILRRAGYKEIFLMSDRDNKIVKLLVWIKEFIILSVIHSNSIVVVQHPVYMKSNYMNVLKILKKIKQIKYIFIVHDLESVRRILKNGEKYQRLDPQMYKLADCIICHNKNMCDYIETKGVDCHKLVSLEMFDYLVPDNYEINHTKSGEKASDNNLIIAGNLGPEWCEYIYSSENGINYPMNLYGMHYDKDKSRSNAYYIGEFSPDELPHMLKGKYGLVWYGNSVEKCGDGNLEHYLCYINPHKVSAYIAAGIPVIIGSNIGNAEYVRENKLGIVVDSIRDIRSIIESIDDQDYLQFRNNVLSLQVKLRKGYFLSKAIAECERRLSNNE